MNDTTSWSMCGAVALVTLSTFAGAACAQQSGAAPATPATTAVATPAAPPLEQFKAAGKAAPLTVVPTRLAGTPMPQVGEVVAMMLERAGMTNLETSAAAFTPPDGADLAQTAKAFAEFVQNKPLTTEYTLFTDFMGSPKTGLTEVRAVVVNAKGEIVWQDRQAKGDADFDRIKPKEPMDCCVLVVERLRPVLGLGDPQSDDAPPGKIAQRWQKATGLPDKAEQAAIEERGKVFAKAAANATLVVYPAHAGDAFSPESAASLARMINDKKLTKATASDAGPRFETAGNMNEQKVLWAMAHAFSEHIKKNPPDADYALFADYLMGKNSVGGVHFAICNKQGDLVVVDFQNSHWPDFKSIDPKTREDCDKLVVKRLGEYCK